MIMYHGLGNHLLVVNSIEAIYELLEKRYNLYSDRPILVMVGELTGGSSQLVLHSYDKEWRDQRKLARAALGMEAVSGYHPLLEQTAATLCKDILEAPADFCEHLQMAISRIPSTIYGIEVESKDNEAPVVSNLSVARAASSPLARSPPPTTTTLP